MNVDEIFYRIATLEARMLTTLPTSNASAVCGTFENILACIVRDPTNPHQWCRLFAFPKLVLCKLSRGATPKMYLETLKRRSVLFMAGKLPELMSEVALRTLAPDNGNSRNSGGPATQQHIPGASQSSSSSQFTTRADDEQTPTAFADIPSCAPPKKILDRACRLASSGFVNRALRTLTACETAPTAPDTTDALRLLHPPSDSVPAPLVVEENTPDVSPCQGKHLWQALRSFAPDSSAGPSGMSARVIVDLIRHRPSLVPLLCSVTTLIMAGRIPAPAREWWFGARLVALRKKDGGIRPIACGEVLRRIAGKVLSHAAMAETALPNSVCGQVALGTKGGADVVFHHFRAASAALPNDEVILKLDFKNAFNTCRRDVIFDTLRTFAPSTRRYATAALSTTHLIFGDQLIDSASGAQQGDPLGPLFFCAALFRSGFHELPNALSRGAYLDDITVRIKVEHAATYVNALEQCTAAVGLKLNRNKCEVIGNSESICNLANTRFPNTTSSSNWELLGAPIGNASRCAAYVSQRMKKLTARLEQLALLPERHVALALMHRLAGISSIDHLLRLCGQSGKFDAWLPSLQGELLKVLPLACASALKRITTPIRAGGLGFFDAPLIADVAFAASNLSARLAPTIFCPGAPARGLNNNISNPTAAARSDGDFAADTATTTATTLIDLDFDAAMHRLRAAPFSITSGDFLRLESDPRAFRREFTKKINQSISENIIGDLARWNRVAEIACCRSATAPYASSWLYDSLAPDQDRLWLSNVEFDIAIKQRFHLAIVPKTLNLQPQRTTEASSSSSAATPPPPPSPPPLPWCRRVVEVNIGSVPRRLLELKQPVAVQAVRPAGAVQVKRR